MHDREFLQPFPRPSVSFPRSFLLHSVIKKCTYGPTERDIRGAVDRAVICSVDHPLSERALMYFVSCSVPATYLLKRVQYRTNQHIRCSRDLRVLLRRIFVSCSVPTIFSLTFILPASLFTLAPRHLCVQALHAKAHARAHTLSRLPTKLPRLSREAAAAHCSCLLACKTMAASAARAALRRERPLAPGDRPSISILHEQQEKVCPLIFALAHRPFPSSLCIHCNTTSLSAWPFSASAFFRRSTHGSIQWQRRPAWRRPSHYQRSFRKCPTQTLSDLSKTLALSRMETPPRPFFLTLSHDVVFLLRHSVQVLELAKFLTGRKGPEPEPGKLRVCCCHCFHFWVRVLIARAPLQPYLRLQIHHIANVNHALAALRSVGCEVKQYASEGRR